ncbi:hypothetical protein EVAR_99914_1 [Eumeta japonica]|uniref:Uncharacterized protein n=1 Tax=Eumeta variegata TaxID=151549 RepID=A0A4C2A953_EUMVA|nr:hypothetical protein EVAR_99914_1 [Eumeta japonica]
MCKDRYCQSAYMSLGRALDRFTGADKGSSPSDQKNRSLILANCQTSFSSVKLNRLPALSSSSSRRSWTLPPHWRQRPRSTIGLDLISALIASPNLT